MDDACAEALTLGVMRDFGGISEFVERMVEANPRGAFRDHYMAILASSRAKAGDADGALAASDEAVRAHGDDANAWSARGDIMGMRGDKEGALECYGRAASLAGPADAPGILCLKASALAGLGRHEECAAAAGLALSYSPGNSEAAGLAVESLMELGRAEEALAAIEGALGRGAGGPELEAQKAMILGGLGRAEEALAAANRHLKGAPTTSAVWYVKACMLARLGKHEPALDALTVAISLEPSAIMDARGEESLDPLRGSERFRRLVG